ncbi:MAG: DNA-formamidopyrimidine glycosylase [Armatimonadetes bacterium]|nr:DNA-formamidopyrimidine glycosylase [Armatimonadota bacterium]
MPELPEVETIKQELFDKILGKKINFLEIFTPELIKNISLGDFKKYIAGEEIKDILRRGKYLILKLKKASLIIHFRMTGKLIFAKNKLPPSKSTHLIFYFEGGDQLIYQDLRKFGEFKLSFKEDFSDILGIKKLGIEPLSKEFRLETFKALLKSKNANLKLFLIDQTKIAGIGNLYACEILFKAKIHPQRKTLSLKEGEIQALYQAIKEILKKAIFYKGSSLRDEQYQTLGGKLGGFQKHHQVYAKAGENCPRCKSIIQKIILGQRGTYFCPNCQE